MQDGQYVTCKGGVALSNITELKEKWITKAEYQEYGPSIVMRKSLDYWLIDGFKYESK